MDVSKELIRSIVEKVLAESAGTAAPAEPYKEKDPSGNVIKPAGTSQQLNTGLTTQFCNIFDMGGNEAEFTTELNPGTSETVVLRGGNYSDHAVQQATVGTVVQAMPTLTTGSAPLYS